MCQDDKQQWELEAGKYNNLPLIATVTAFAIALTACGAIVSKYFEVAEASSQAALAELQDMRTMSLKMASLELRLDALEQEIVVLHSHANTLNHKE